MPEYIVDLWLDGYDTEEQMEEACDEFIYEQLNFTASSVKVKRSDYAALLARHTALVEAVKRLLAADDELLGEQWSEERHKRLQTSYHEARAEVDRLIASEQPSNSQEAE